MGDDVTTRTLELPTWSAAQQIVAPRAMLGPFIWWAILGDGLKGIELVPVPEKEKRQ